MKRSKIWLKLCLAVLAVPAFAGLHPLHTLVVVNDHSPSSQTIGHYYAQQRGIPERNICHITVTTNNNLSVAAFSNDVRGPILATINAGHLTNQISALVLSRDIPYRIYDAGAPSYEINGLPPALFYGYKNAPSYPMPASTTNQYYAKEQPFASDLFGSANRQYLTFILTSATGDQSLNLIDRTASCNSTFPTGTVYLLHTTDERRSVQWPQYNDTLFLYRLLNPDALDCVTLDTNNMIGQSAVMGHHLGQSSVDSLSLNTYLPGAIACHLTSFGGSLFDSAPQMSILTWLRHGCAGSYGTCTEPYNIYPQKFPAIPLYFWYARGFSLGEALYMAVQNPYEGVFVGDPLCAPYAMPASLSCGGIPPNAVLSGTVTATVQAVAHDARHPLDRIDVYLDGLLQQTLTNVVPATGNTIRVTISGANRSLTVSSGDTLYTLAGKVKNLINQAPPLGITATNTGDRISLLQNTPGISTSGLVCSAQSELGAGAELTVQTYATQTNFLETSAAAYEQLILKGIPSSGDVVRAVITTLDPLRITNEIIAAAGDTISTLLNALNTQINADTNLQTTTGCSAKYPGNPYGTYYESYLTARTNTYEGLNLEVDFQVIPAIGSALTNTSFSDTFNDNADDLKGRALFFLAIGKTNLNASFTLDTDTLADGPHTLTFLAREGTGVGTLSATTISFRVSNTLLDCRITTPVNLANYSASETISITVTASSPNAITGVVLYVEGKKKALTNGVPWNTSINATNYGPGLLTLQAEAFDNAGNQTLSDPVQLVIYQDTDSDGLPDWWEYQHFGGSTNAVPTDDTDSDSADNRDEYIASTVPTNMVSVLASAITHDPASTNIVLQWPGSSLRFYNVFYRDELLTSSWCAAESTPFRGWDPATSWTNSAVTNTHRAYRIQAIIP